MQYLHLPVNGYLQPWLTEKNTWAYLEVPLIRKPLLLKRKKKMGWELGGEIFALIKSILRLCSLSGSNSKSFPCFHIVNLLPRVQIRWGSGCSVKGKR